MANNVGDTLDRSSYVTAHVEITPSDTLKLVEGELVTERLLGPTGARELLINAMVLVFYLVLLSIPFISFAFVSGGMRWIIVVMVVTTIALYTIYIMNMGIQKRIWKKTIMEKKYFSGDLSRTNDIITRGAGGYSYSQQLMREMMAEAMIEKIRQGRGMTIREIEMAIDEPERFREIVGDEAMAAFILANQKKAEGWSDRTSRKKSDREKVESGRKFMLEIKDILEKVEVWE